MSENDIIKQVNNIPEGKLGVCEIDKFKVSRLEAKIFNIRLNNNESDRWINEGEYTRLTIDGKTMMSNTHAEIKDHLEFIGNAKGDVLITGLGLAMVSSAIVNKPEVDSVTIIEKNQDIIDLVSPYIDDKIKVIKGDVFSWEPDREFDMAWHDIWLNISGDNLPEMVKIKRRFSDHVEDQYFWCLEECIDAADPCNMNAFIDAIYSGDYAGMDDIDDDIDDDMGY